MGDEDPSRTELLHKYY